MEKPKKQKTSVFLLKVDFPDDPPKKVFLPSTFNQLLKIAEDALDLPRPAQQIFDAKNQRITNIEDIAAKSKLYVSCTKPLPEIDSEPLYKTRTIAPSNKKTAKKANKQPIKEVRADAKNHQIIAASQKSVRDNVRDALISLFNSLTPEHKAQLNCREELKKLTSDTQHYLLDHYLLSQFIGPTSDVLTTQIGMDTWKWCINHVTGLKVENVKLLITGPEKSGKSTIVNFLSSIVIQKLIISGEISNYLVCAINWSKYESFAGDVCALYEVFLDATLEGLKASKMQFLPIINTLRQWMISLRVTPATPALPAQLSRFPGFPTKDITLLGQKINSAFNNKSSLKEFIQECVSLPNSIAFAFGFKNVIPVYDHFDLTGYIIKPYGKYEESMDQVLLSEELCANLELSPFIVASLNDTNLSRVFNVSEFKNYTTERIIQSNEEVTINVSEPTISINYDMCRGCPAYCAMYERIIQLAENETDNRVITQAYSKIQSTVDSTRRVMIKQELGRLISLLLMDDDEMSETFNIDDVNEFMAMDEVIVKLK